MSLGMQVKILRVLQERELTRVGGEEVLQVDVRLIAATNRDLLKEIEAARRLGITRRTLHQKLRKYGTM